MNLDIFPDAPVRATVDQLDMVTGGGAWQFRVFVRTAPWWPRQLKRVYLIDGPSDNFAAMEGIRRLVEEEKELRARLSKIIPVH